MAHLPVQCGDCGAHFMLDPSGSVQGTACSECGGSRFFRNQPSPTQSDGTLRDMVDSDSQKDQGGNPLGEGTIMGDDGEKPQFKRDNFMHGKVASEHLAYPGEIPVMYEGMPDIPEGMGAQDFNRTRQKGKCEGCGYDFITFPGQPPYCSRCLAQHPELSYQPHNVQARSLTSRDMRPETLNMEPYPALWDTDERLREAGFLAPLIPEGLAAGAEALGIGGGAAAGAGAADAAGAAGGGGLLSSLAGGAGKLMKGALGAGRLYSGAKGLEGLLGIGGGDAQQSGNAAPQMNQGPDPELGMAQLASTDIPFILLADMDTPHSVKSVGEQHDDPEDQDQKEFNDGDKSPSNLKNPNNEDSGASGEDGVRDATPGYGFGPNSPSIERLQMLLPLVLHYFNSEESGQSDPILRSLHEALEGESPGYMDQEHPDADHHLQIILQHGDQPKHAGVNAMPGGMPAVPAQGGGVCPQCGAPTAADGSCPQCGAKQHPVGGASQMGAGGASMPPNVAGKTANHQGPVTPEQMAAVQQLLLHQHRDDEIPNVPLHPENYSKEMAEIQGNPNVAPQVPPEQMAPQPPAPMENPQGAMPVMDPSQPGGGGGQPMQPMAKQAVYTLKYNDGNESEEDDEDAAHDTFDAQSAQGLEPKLYKGDEWGENRRLIRRPGQPRSSAAGDTYQCPGCKGTVQYQADKSNPYRGLASGNSCNTCKTPIQEFKRVTADANTLAPRCPKCTSATTSVRDGNEGEGAKGLRCHACGHEWTPKESRVVLTEMPNPALQNAADQHQGRPNEGQDSSLVWQDASGQPLVEGQTYELSSPQYQIPDVVQVVYKHPGELGLKLVGEFGNIQTDSHEPDFKITPQQLQMENYSFAPANDQGAQTEEPPLGGTPGLEQIPQTPPTTDELTQSYPNSGTVSSIVMAGEDEIEVNDDLCHKCGGTWVEHIASTPTRTMHECARCGSVWETADEDQGRTASSDLNWIYDSSGQDDFWAGMERAQATQESRGSSSRSLSAAVAKDERYQRIKDVLADNAQARNERTAGRHFTPSEQRALINERGTARNSDLLDLSNTHYEARYDYTGKANGENVPDGHLVFGL